MSYHKQLDEAANLLADGIKTQSGEEVAGALGAFAVVLVAQLIRIADSLEKLATVVELPPPSAKPEPVPPPPEAPYARDGCHFPQCPTPELCQPNGTCIRPGGWGVPRGVTCGSCTRPGYCDRMGYCARLV